MRAYEEPESIWKGIVPIFGSVLVSIVGAVAFSFTTFDMKDAAKERSDFLNQKIEVLRQEQKDDHHEVMMEFRRLDQKVSKARR